MNWPQITLIILFAFGLGVPPSDTENHVTINTASGGSLRQPGDCLAALVWRLLQSGPRAQPPQAALQYRDDVIRNARLNGDCLRRWPISLRNCIRKAVAT